MELYKAVYICLVLVYTTQSFNLYNCPIHCSCNYFSRIVTCYDLGKLPDLNQASIHHLKLIETNLSFINVQYLRRVEDLRVITLIDNKNLKCLNIEQMQEEWYILGNNFENCIGE